MLQPSTPAYSNDASNDMASASLGISASVSALQRNLGNNRQTSLNVNPLQPQPQPTGMSLSEQRQ
jgi:hypothetical protein